MTAYTPRDDADAARVARVIAMGNLVLSNGNGMKVGTWGPRYLASGESVKFELACHTYVAIREGGVVTKLSKRGRTNRLGTFYTPMAMKGKAAKLVLAAMKEAGMVS